MEETYIPQKRRRRRHHRRGCGSIFLLCLTAVVITGVYLHVSSLKDRLDHEHSWQGSGGVLPDTEFGQALEAFAASHDLTVQDWPGELLELGEIGRASCRERV